MLRAAADLIAPSGAWTQGAFARDAAGRGVGLDDQGAVCWCAAGAIHRFAPAMTSPFLIDAVSREVRGYRNVATFNDDPERTQAEVVAKLRQVADRIDREDSRTARHPINHEQTP